MKSPFKFLDSYTKDDRDIFFGRDSETEELYQRVFASRLLLVYGVSGTGKSSLINCGLANKFSETDWLPVNIRRAGDIVRSMASAIRKSAITPLDGEVASPIQFQKAVRSLYLDHYKPVFFIFDQFEELFIFGDKEERRSFIHIVKSLTESDFQCRMIFVMREEYMAAVTEFEKFIPTFFSNRVRIEKMSHRNALEVVKQPCKVFNISLEEGFAESLLEKLSPGSEDVELTYLQVFLDKIFRLSAQDKLPLGRDGGSASHGEVGSLARTFTLSLLSKTGNVSDLLGSFLEEQISLMEDPDTAMSVLKAFVSGKGTKHPASELEAIDNIRSFGKQISKEKVKEQIQSFVKLRVLRDKDENDRYELRHDALAEKISEKFSKSEKELLELKQLIENAYQYYLKRKILLSNEDLNEIAGRDTLLNLSSELQEFINESRKNLVARKRNVKILTSISVFALLILLITVLSTLIKNSNRSQSILLAKESMLQFTRPVDRLSLAGSAWKTSRTEEAKEALLTAFNFAIRNAGDNEELANLRNKYFVRFTPVSSEILYAVCSKDNKFICGYSKDSIFVWEKTGRLFTGFGTGGTPMNLQISGDGTYIGFVNTDNILTVRDIMGHVTFSHKVGLNPFNKDQIFRFDTENRVVAVSSDRGAELLDAKGNVIQSFRNHEGSVNAVDISDDRRFIATAGTDSTANIWYFNTITKKYDIYNLIKFPTDTIYSIDFAPNCKYVLTTSSNGTIRITSVNGEVTWGIRDKYEEFSSEINLGCPFFAEFNHSGTGIVIKSLKENYDWENYFMVAIYVDYFYINVRTGQVNYFEKASISPDSKYFIVTDNDNIYLLSYLNKPLSEFQVINNYRLLQMKGSQAFFSPDNKFIYSISGNHLESWYIDTETISRIAVDLFDKWDKYF